MLTCEAEGHDFTVWQPGSNAEEQLTGREYRYCRRCCLHESRALASVVGGVPRRGKSAAVQGALLSVAGAHVTGEVA